MQALRLLLSALVLAILLSACGGPGFDQSAQTASYTITMQVDQTHLGDQNVTLTITNRDGQPVTADKVVLTPVMRSMGMASPDTIAQATGPGHYQAQQKISFSMTGEWDIAVHVTVKNSTEIATFKIPIT